MNLHYPLFLDAHTIALSAIEHISLAMATDKQFKAAESHRKRYPKESGVDGKIEKPKRTIGDYQKEIAELAINLQHIHAEVYVASNRIGRLLAATAEDKKK